MGKGHVQSDFLPNRFFDIRNVRQKFLRDRNQRLRWPSMKPVELRTVHQGWELPCADSEFITHLYGTPSLSHVGERPIAYWTETEHDMEKSPNLLDEEIPQVLWRIDKTCRFGFVSHSIAEALSVFLKTADNCWRSCL